MRGGPDDVRAEGILLYPENGRRLDLSYGLHGHAIRVCTIDLGQQWADIRQDLLDLLNRPT